MFERFIRFQIATKALKAGRYDEALRLAQDPKIADDRRAEEVREAARRELCTRARERIAIGEWEAGIRDFERAEADRSQPEVAAELLAARKRWADAKAAMQADVALQAQIVASITAGRLGEAEALLEQHRARLPSHLAQELSSDAQARRVQAAQRVAEAERAISRGELQSAQRSLATARSFDADAGHDLEAQIRTAMARQQSEAALRHAKDGDPIAAVHELASMALTSEEHTPPLAAIGDRLLQQWAAVAEHDAVAQARGFLAEAAKFTRCVPTSFDAARNVAALLCAADDARTAGRHGDLAVALGNLSAVRGFARFANAAKAAAEVAAKAAVRIAAARAQLSSGMVDAAREELRLGLLDCPANADLWRETEAIESSVLARAERLAAAHKLAQEGHLVRALTMAQSDAHPGPLGSGFAALEGELRRRIAAVEESARQLVADFDAGSLAGEQCLSQAMSRCEDLLRQHADHEGLLALRSALAGEAQALELLRLGDATRSLSDEATALVAALSQRASLRNPRRLDSALTQRVVVMQKSAEAALARGEIELAQQCALALTAAAAAGFGSANAVRQLDAECDQRRQQAEAAVQLGRAKLAERDLAAAERHGNEAERLWRASPAVLQLRADLRRIQRGDLAMGRAQRLVAVGEASMARAEIDAMGATPPSLRTRIFDMKRSIAKAQGLDGAFVLRVDEGGEFLVLRGDSLSIGNLRDGSADLPILCALAKRHARIERSMSFHGGMQDTIVADGGAVTVNGESVASRALRPMDRVKLGAALQIVYSQPCSRSLTAQLHLQGGFQAAGTDRVLLLKDRGRDGRICIGSGKDVHVRVGSATAEVEVFASKTGQLRVRCGSGGEVDGEAFSDERPIDAGAVVRAGGISFVLAPFRAHSSAAR